MAVWYHYRVVTHTPVRERRALHHQGTDKAIAEARYAEVASRIVAGATVELTEDGRVIDSYTRPEQ